jgi:8-oxo-dGTP diphosphatase
MSLPYFNIRIYGILLNEQKQVLVTDEIIRGKYITKFPGGGLEFGEGTKECLIREFKEELSLDIEIQDHFYTTDFFQVSAFNPQHQIISIYYLVKPTSRFQIADSKNEFEFTETEMKQYEKTGETETFRFIDWRDFSENSVSLPIDKHVAKLVQAKF